MRSFGFTETGVLEVVSFANTKPDTDLLLDESMPDLHVGELFVGAGGFGLGFILANHPQVRYCPLFAIDLDSVALQSYTRNMDWLSQHANDVLHDLPLVEEADIASFDMSEFMQQNELDRGNLDILIGGPPCQGFSSSNKSRKVQEKQSRNNLVSVFLDKVNNLYPKMFLMENVQGVRWTKITSEMCLPHHQNVSSPDSESSSMTVKEFLEHKAQALGYEVWSSFEDSADFGVPQHRLRFFLFGVRRDLIDNDQEVSLTPHLQKLKVLANVTVSDAINDLPSLENGQIWNGTSYQPEPENEYVAILRQHMSNGELYDHFTTRHNDNVLKRFRLIPEGQNWQSIRDQMTTYKDIDNTHRNIYRRLRADAPANTISHYRKSMVIHPSQHRGLSFREACRLQSCPDWFRFEGNRGQQQQQLANMVPPLMAKHVAFAVAEYWLQICQNRSKEKK